MRAAEELARYFARELVGGSALGSGLGRQLDRIRVGLAGSHAPHADATEMEANALAGVMAERWVRAALGLLSSRHIEVLFEHYRPRPPNNPHGLRLTLLGEWAVLSVVAAGRDLRSRGDASDPADHLRQLLRAPKEERESARAELKTHRAAARHAHDRALEAYMEARDEARALAREERSRSFRARIEGSR